MNGTCLQTIVLRKFLARNKPPGIQNHQEPKSPNSIHQCKFYATGFILGKSSFQESHNFLQNLQKDRLVRGKTDQGAKYHRSLFSYTNHFLLFFFPNHEVISRVLLCLWICWDHVPTDKCLKNIRYQSWTIEFSNYLRIHNRWPKIRGFVRKHMSFIRYRHKNQQWLESPSNGCIWTTVHQCPSVNVIVNRDILS